MTLVSHARRFRPYTSSADSPHWSGAQTPNQDLSSVRQPLQSTPQLLGKTLGCLRTDVWFVHWELPEFSILD